MRRARSRRGAVGLCLCASVVLGSCTTAGDTSTPPPQQLQACGDTRTDQGITLSAYCMQIPSADPNMPIQIGVLSTNSADPLTHRRLLIYHPGGPGVSAVSATFADPPEVDYSAFVVATWDGRTSSSVPSGCGPDSEAFAVDRSPGKLSSLASATAVECKRNVGWHLEPGASGAYAAAEELLRVHQALGFDQFDMFTHSYGSGIAEAYLRMHPESVRRAVLDSPIVLDASWEDRLRSVRAAVLGALSRLLDCDRSRCGARTAMLLHDATSPYERVRTSVLAEEPRVGVTRLTLTATAFDQAALMALRDRALWPEFLKGIEAALGGDATYLWSLGQRYFYGVDRYVYYASMCADFRIPSTLDGFIRQEPLMFTYASEFSPCLAYPKAAKLPSPAPPADSAVVVIASPLDVLTPGGLLTPGTWLRSVATVCDASSVGHTSVSAGAMQRVVGEYLLAGTLKASTQLSCDGE